jgi:hypothetical protein
MSGSRSAKGRPLATIDDGPPGLDEIERKYRLRLAEFLAAPKSAVGPMRWRGRQQHKDYLSTYLRISHPFGRHVRAHLALNAHIYFLPRKYSFSLIYNHRRIASLDTSPRRSHTNLLRKETVWGTHWSFYPCDDVVQDDRPLVHSQWLDEFCTACNIEFAGRYSSPVHDKEQLELGL